MNATNFFSSSTYVFLPSKKNPKVALSVDNAKLSENAFKLYNPFSDKSKLFKKVTRSAFINLNTMSKKVLNVEKKEKSKFVKYLEEKLGQPLVSSLYFATIGDKIVMQLQTSEAQVVGYVKYPLNAVGLKHLENEKKAIEILSTMGIVPKYLMHDAFKGKTFLLLKTLEGDIGLVTRTYVDEIVSKFRREESFKLSEHPRIVELKTTLETNGLSRYMTLVKTICQNSTKQYALVYEHGDFTPWNIVKVEDQYTPFDFEHFVEDGLEYFDLIKYYYQVGKLLEGLNGKELIEYMAEEINIEEMRELLQLFLIKEIVRNKEEGEPYDFEVEMIETMERL